MELLSPGIYTKDKNTGPGPIQAVSVSNFATAGWLKKGPVAEPTLVTTLDNFIDKFGTYWNNSYVPYVVAAYFYCGGSRAYIVREVPDDAEKASSTLNTISSAAKFYSKILSDPITVLDASNYNINVDIDDAGAADIDVTGDSGAAGSYALSAIASNITGAGLPCSVVTDYRGGKRLLFQSSTTGSSSELEFKPAAGDDCSKLILGHDGSSTYTYNGKDAVDRWDYEFPYEGDYGNDYGYALVGNEDYKDDPDGGYTKYDFVVYDKSGTEKVEVFRVEVVDLTDSEATDYFPEKVNDKASDYVVVTEGDTPGVPYQLSPETIEDEWSADGDGSETDFSFKTLMYPIALGSLEVTDGTETFSDNGDGTLTGSAGGSGTVNYNTGSVSVTFNAAPADGDRITSEYKSRYYESEAYVANTGGDDGTGSLGRSNLTAPALQSSKRGIYAFDKIEDILIVSVPDLAGSVNVANDLITWAENEKNRFVVLDPASGLDAQEHKEYVQDLGSFDSMYAAYYAPQVKVADPVGENRPLLVPNSGHVVGCYARTASRVNVAKAPAGTTDGKLFFVNSVETVFDKGERDILYPARVNPIMSSDLTGIVLWGCKTLSRDTNWRYVQNVLTYMMVRESIYRSSQWIVFRNNGPELWSEIRNNFSSFLKSLYDKKYFKGKTTEEAYRVVCDDTINTDETVDRGEVYVDIYMALQKPAEFVVLRFAQKTADGE